jgi:hypothetical protein
LGEAKEAPVKRNVSFSCVLSNWAKEKEINSEKISKKLIRFMLSIICFLYKDVIQK